jgi:hypothetical protein
LAALLERGVSQATLYARAEAFNGSRHTGELLLAERIVAQLLLLSGQCLHPLLQFTPASLILVKRNDAPEIGVG